jgi:hypothetical protein
MTTATASVAPLVPDGERLVPGTPVEVRCRFVERWARGYEVAGVVHPSDCPRYRIRRVSDGAELPETFGPEELRPAPGRLPASWGRASARVAPPA